MPSAKKTLPNHVGIIPDGNRRWAEGRGMPRHEGYASGIAPGYELYEICKELGVPEVSVYGFTQDNTRRPKVVKEAFRAACVEFGLEITRRGAALLCLGDETSAQFPSELASFRQRTGEGIRVNFLVNYGWQWDIQGLKEEGSLKSADVAPLDLIVRWGGGRRLSGFLPVQSVYADFYVVNEYWPDFRPGHFWDALEWFKRQDRTLGG